MKAENKRFFKELVSQASPSGFESPAQKVFEDYLKNIVDEIYGDYTGNRIAVLKSKSKNPLKIMIAGHCDEIGLMATTIEETGQIRANNIGGVDPAVLPGQYVIIHTKTKNIPGVIGRKAIHLLKKEERGQVKKEQLWIDCGFSNKKEAEKVIRVGDPISYAPNYLELAGKNIVSKGCDDKVGVFVVAETMRMLAEKRSSLKSDVYGVSTTMEEIGLRGARTAAAGITPDIGIAIDVTHCTDYPDADKKLSGEISLGKGPVIARGANVSSILFEALVSLAEKNKIPYQIEAEPNATGTDANAIQVTGKGVATALISIPNRYMHTPSEVVNLTDLENAARLLTELILTFTPKTNLII
ncbi:M42 family metallopeptidase [bacterium]|nr:M42 family metallopeptidase [bacterium]